MEKLKKRLMLTGCLFLVFSMEARARIVTHVEIETVGLVEEGRHDKSEEEACKVFMPTEKQIIQYFNHAKASKESGTLLHEYYSPCISTGRVQFKDGATGHWTLQSSGLGLVIFDNGQATTFFRTGNEWTDPYACTYGLGDDPIC